MNSKLVRVEVTGRRSSRYEPDKARWYAVAEMRPVPADDEDQADAEAVSPA